MAFSKQRADNGWFVKYYVGLDYVVILAVNELSQFSFAYSWACFSGPCESIIGDLINRYGNQSLGTL